MLPLSLKTKREWRDPTGYRFLAAWSNAVLLEILVRKFTETLVHEYRLKAQLDDCARSVVSNIVEGFKRPTTHEYLDFLGFSQGSLEEVKSDVGRSLQNGFLKSVPGSSLANLGIDLKTWNNYCRDPLNSPKFLYFPLSKGIYRTLKDVKGEDLSYEIFMELINKTDYLLRTLVVSLQKKGDYNEELKKDPHAAAEKEFDAWIDKQMEKSGAKNYKLR